MCGRVRDKWFLIQYGNAYLTLRFSSRCSSVHSSAMALRTCGRLLWPLQHSDDCLYCLHSSLHWTLADRQSLVGALHGCNGTDHTKHHLGHIGAVHAPSGATTQHHLRSSVACDCVLRYWKEHWSDPGIPGAGHFAEPVPVFVPGHGSRCSCDCESLLRSLSLRFGTKMRCPTRATGITVRVGCW